LTLSDTIDITAFSADDVDDVWTFFQRVPEGDRTLVKEPVTEPGAVSAWVDDARALRYVARLDGDVVGYVAVFPGVGWSKHVGELRLVVDPAVRRQGIGHRLARYALRVALEASLTKVVVEVAAVQESTIALFTGLGFRAEALLEDQVQDPAGNYTDLIVLANRTDADWGVLATVGLDEQLD
jgi:ribosomal protein S18 acetylase RimI-like enzyme